MTAPNPETLRAMQTEYDRLTSESRAAEDAANRASEALRKARLEAKAAGQVDVGLSYPLGTVFVQLGVRAVLDLSPWGDVRLWVLTKSGKRHATMSPIYASDSTLTRWLRTKHKAECWVPETPQPAEVNGGQS